MANSATDFTLAVDASWLRDGGIARMANEVIERKPPNVRIVEIRREKSPAGVFTPLDLALAARAVEADAIWSPGFMPPLFKPPGKRVFITIHDLAHLQHYSNKHRLYYDSVIRRLLGNVDRLFTVSDYTAEEIVRWASVDRSRIERIYNGVSKAFVATGAVRAHDRPYILYVGNRRSYKNIERLIVAFARSELVELGFELLLTGSDDGLTSTWAAEQGIRDSVRYLGAISDADLASAYRGASALAFLSLYEGFGLPVVEAMACGCPVVTSSSTALAEVAGSAAVTVDPCSIDAIATALKQICLNEPLRADLRAAGLVRSAQFSWDVAAANYWGALVPGDRDR